MSMYLDTPTILALPAPRSRVGRTVFLCFAAALVLTAVHVAVTLTFSHSNTLRGRYEALGNWDGEWYQHIAFAGYRVLEYPLKTVGIGNTNVAFFPGFPLSIRAVHALTGLPEKISIMLAAETACVGFWTYFLLLCRRWKISLGGTTLAILLVMGYPSSFFLIAGYSESLFLLACLGFFYWCTHEHKHSWIVAALHGVILTATRPTGLPIVALPVLLFLLTRRGLTRPHSDLRPWLTAAIASLGTVSFFAYCQWQFGHWNLYSEAQQVGWNLKPNLYRIFDPQTYRFIPMSLEHLDTDVLNQNVVIVCLITLLSVCGIDVLCTGFRKGFRERFVLYFASFAMFALCVDMIGPKSLIRYSLPIYILCVLAMLHLLSKNALPQRVRQLSHVLIPAFIIVSASLQFKLITVFTSFGWVA